MNTAKAKPKTRDSELDLLPRDEALKRADELLRRMLNTPPQPFTPKPKAKAKKRGK